MGACHPASIGSKRTDKTQAYKNLLKKIRRRFTVTPSANFLPVFVRTRYVHGTISHYRWRHR